MKNVEVNPEVITGLGSKSILNNSTHPPKVEYLHLLLEDWLGDDLMEIFPCFIVTEQLAMSLEETNFTGYEVEEVEVEEDEYFENNYSLDKPLPPFKWLKITGKNTDDFSVNSSNHKLILSENVYNWLTENFTCNHLTKGKSKAEDFMQRFKSRQAE